MKHAVDKKRNKKGFTLAELLIVVAIIAILVAIMVPVFGTSRANAIHAKDLSNIRSAYSEAVTNALALNQYEDAKLEVSLDVNHESPSGSGSSSSVSVIVDKTTTVSYKDGETTITVTTEKASGPSTIDVDPDIKLTLGGDAKPEDEGSSG